MECCGGNTGQTHPTARNSIKAGHSFMTTDLAQRLVEHAVTLAAVLAALGQDTGTITHDIAEAKLALAQEEIFD